MNDLIRYNNILHDEGPDSPTMANILAAHDGDEEFMRRAQAIRFAHEVRRINKTQRSISWILIMSGAALVAVGIYQLLHVIQQF